MGGDETGGALRNFSAMQRNAMSFRTQAVFQNKTNYLTMLLQFGIDPNACDYGECARPSPGAPVCALAPKSKGRSLSYSSGRVWPISRLLFSPLLPPCADRRTAAHIACAEGRLSAALILQEYGADFEFMDRWGQSATHEVCD